jgi:hypothetical protein
MIFLNEMANRTFNEAKQTISGKNIIKRKIFFYFSFELDKAKK